MNGAHSHARSGAFAQFRLASSIPAASPAPASASTAPNRPSASRSSGWRDDVGQPLLNRNGKDVTPTEAGERLLSYARRLLALAEEARDVVARARTARARCGSVCPRILPPIGWRNCWRRSRARIPACGSTCAPTRARNLERDLERGELDLALFKRDRRRKGRHRGVAGARALGHQQEPSASIRAPARCR